MIYYNDIRSIVECIYLGERLEEKFGRCNIFINPDNISYLVGKIIIINDIDYPEENISVLIKNNCKIISRVYTSDCNVLFNPYILKIEDNIMWNGDFIYNINDLELLIDSCSFDPDRNKLFFPKLLDHDFNVQDDKGNLNWLGWVLQQVGVNIISDTPFKDLDIIKTRKFRNSK